MRRVSHATAALVYVIVSSLNTRILVKILNKMTPHCKDVASAVTTKSGRHHVSICSRCCSCNPAGVRIS